MNKYFLPVYHSELKPWIKWWILKRLNGESTLRAITISSGTLKKVDTSKALSIQEYYGNTVQDGTPSPESPVEIKTISEENTFTINDVNYSLNLKSKNLCYTNYTDWEIGGYNVAGIKETNTGRARLIDLIPVKPNTTYYINTNNELYKFVLRGYNSTKGFVGSYGAIDNGATITTGPLVHFISATLFNPNNELAGEGQNIINKIQSGDIKPFICLNSEQDKTYTTYYNYELCKIGDYQDKIYNDNGTWKVEKKIGKITFDGSEEWFYFSSSSKPVFYLLCENYGINYKQQSGLICYSNYYLGKGQVYSFDNVYDLGNNIITFRTSYTRLCIRDDRFTVPSALKNWLTTNNVTVYYALASTSTETITNTNLISQLNALYEFYVESRTVSISNDSEIPFEVLLEYYGR